MNIAAVMAALVVDDLDHTAKFALLVIACRTNQHTIRASVSIGRLAQDMGVHRMTAQHAVWRAVDAGYLTVDKSPGRRHIYTVTCSAAHQVPDALHAKPDALRITKDIEGLKEGALPPTRAAGGSVENPAVAFAPGTGRLPNWSRGEQ